MSVVMVCACGKRLQVNSSAIGKRVKCPSCGKALVVDEGSSNEKDEPPDEDAANEETKTPKKKGSSMSEPKLKRRKGSSGRRLSLLGIGVVGWLMILVALAGTATVAILVLPRFIPSLGKEPYYIENDAGDHLLVTIHNTKAGSVPVKIMKRATRSSYDQKGTQIGLSGFELPNFSQSQGTTNKNGQTVTWEVECSGDGVTRVMCDGKAVRKSPWQ